mmetsp:Transcript_24631/g.66989  ORF Transcript_24631/g.66989 Transcript_24631/m.66989 type:complete len:413 (+) Transcript_24631:128-1366(+)
MDECRLRLTLPDAATATRRSLLDFCPLWHILREDRLSVHAEGVLLLEERPQSGTHSEGQLLELLELQGRVGEARGGARLFSRVAQLSRKYARPRRGGGRGAEKPHILLLGPAQHHALAFDAAQSHGLEVAQHDHVATHKRGRVGVVGPQARHDLPLLRAQVYLQHPQPLRVFGVRIRRSHLPDPHVGRKVEVCSLGRSIGRCVLLRAAKALLQGGHLVVRDGPEEQLWLAQLVPLGQRELKGVGDAVCLGPVVDAEHFEDARGKVGSHVGFKDDCDEAAEVDGHCTHASSSGGVRLHLLPRLALLEVDIAQARYGHGQAQALLEGHGLQRGVVGLELLVHLRHELALSLAIQRCPRQETAKLGLCKCDGAVNKVTQVGEELRVVLGRQVAPLEGRVRRLGPVGQEVIAEDGH